MNTAGKYTLSLSFTNIVYNYINYFRTAFFPIEQHIKKSLFCYKRNIFIHFILYISCILICHSNVQGMYVIQTSYHVSQMSVSQMVSHPLPKHTHIKVTLINMAAPAGSSAIVITAVCCI